MVLMLKQSQNVDKEIKMRQESCLSEPNICTTVQHVCHTISTPNSFFDVVLLATVYFLDNIDADVHVLQISLFHIIVTLDPKM